MRILLTADTHVQEDRIEDFEQLLLGDIPTLVKREKADYFCLLGDAWHEKHNVSPKVLNLLYKCGEELSKICKPVWVRGNHEVGLKSHPHETSYIQLFSKVWTVISDKARPVFSYNDVTFWAVPWFQPDKFRRVVAKVAEQPGNKVLLSHVAINEGFVSASNSYRPETGVKLADLRPDQFAFILLGDYHCHQSLGDNCVYLGNPIPLAHGDKEHGLWLLDMAKGGQLSPVGLLSTYPQFVEIDLRDRPDKPVAFDPKNYTRFKVTQTQAEALQRQYVGPHVIWDIEGATNEAVAFRSRATEEELSTPTNALKKWLELKGLGDNAELFHLALDYLEKGLNR